MYFVVNKPSKRHTAHANAHTVTIGSATCPTTSGGSYADNRVVCTLPAGQGTVLVRVTADGQDSQDEIGEWFRVMDGYIYVCVCYTIDILMKMPDRFHTVLLLSQV